VAVDGVRLYVERAGEGPPLLLVPGLGAGNWLWDGWTDALAADFTLVMPELRGSARSDKPDEPYTIGRFTRDVIGVLDHYGITRTHVLGVSMGGFVAQTLAAEAPARVSRLVLVGTSLGGAHQLGPAGEVLARTIRPRGRTRRERFDDGYELGFTPSYRTTHRERLDALSEWRLEHPQPEWAYYRQVLAGWAYDGVRTTARITAPTLICAAESDPVVPHVNAIALRDHIRGARVQTFAGRHLFFIEDPAPITQAVAAFLHGDAAD
jgi:pimeloyl-ACP methyl ester carboxylesterase